ncbi:MAG: hypothetical protein R3286_22025 [Gammaproteobacteria bacterium]|nr:hypothetical protein [Gammaproteobacteria bacterium]
MRRTLRRLTAGALAGLLLTSAWADQNDARLDDLFEALKTTPSAHQAQAVEAEIWRIWIESGREDVDALMAEGIRAMAAARIDEAITLFSEIIERAPRFAEGWNKRATAYYLDENYAASVEDIRHTLALEPRHFGAISGMGLIFLSGGDETGALRAFEAVLEIHPHAPGARQRVEVLRRKLRGEGA